MNRIDLPYVAVTEFEGDDPDAIMKELALKSCGISRLHRPVEVGFSARA